MEDVVHEPFPTRRTALTVEAPHPSLFRHRWLSLVVSRVTGWEAWTLVTASANAIAVELTFAEYRKHGREVCIVGAVEQRGALLRVSDRHSASWKPGDPMPRVEPFLPLA